MRRPITSWPGLARAGLLAGLLAITVVWAMAPSPASVLRAYGHALDARVARYRPALWPYLQGDPALHELAVRQTRPAFLAGGWAEVARKLDQVKFRELVSYAGDHQVTVCAAAWAAAKKSLLAQPAECRAYLQGGVDAAIAEAMVRADQACGAAVEQGAARRRAGVMPRIMGEADFAAAYRLSLEQPDPLSASERAALAGGYGDDALTCRASVRRDSNLLSLPEGVVAAYKRREYALGGGEAARPDAAVRARPPETLHCPAAGTVLTVSRQGVESWRVTGQDGWDCLVADGAGAPAPVWRGVRNPLPLLWPLAVGKTAHVMGADENGAPVSIQFTVRSLATYALPSGWVSAFAIDEVERANGAVLRVVTHDWSPELGMEIARLPRGAGQGWAVRGVAR